MTATAPTVCPAHARCRGANKLDTDKLKVGAEDTLHSSFSSRDLPEAPSPLQTTWNSGPSPDGAAERGRAWASLGP